MGMGVVLLIVALGAKDRVKSGHGDKHFTDGDRRP